MIRIEELGFFPADLIPVVAMRDSETDQRAEVLLHPQGGALYVRWADRIFEVPVKSLVDNVKHYNAELDEPRCFLNLYLKETDQLAVSVHRPAGELGEAKRQAWQFIRKFAKKHPGTPLRKDAYRAESGDWVRPAPPAPPSIVKIVKEMPPNER